MFRKILLPVDLSDRHGPALEIGKSLAKQNDGEINLLHVIEIIAGLSLREERDFYGKLQKAADAHFKKLEVRLKLRNVPVHRKILFGHRGPTVVKYAKEIRADLIVLTAPQVDLKNPSIGWGSLSFKISILARCPVLLVK